MGGAHYHRWTVVWPSAFSQSHHPAGRKGLAPKDSSGTQPPQEAEVILALLVQGSEFVTSVLVVLNGVHTVPPGKDRAHCCLGPPTKEPSPSQPSESAPTLVESLETTEGSVASQTVNYKGKR